MSIKIFIFTFFLFFATTQATLMEQFLSTLPEPQQQMEAVIIRQFANEYYSATTLDQLKEAFKTYKTQWSKNMVEFLIRQLDLNEDGARQARKNPESFYINFETYKLFVNTI